MDLFNCFGKNKASKEKSVNVKEETKTEGLNLKTLFLTTLQGELTKLAEKDIKAGKLNPTAPYDLKANSVRLITAWRDNPMTSLALKTNGITDEELVEMMRNVLVGLNFTQIIE